MASRRLEVQITGDARGARRAFAEVNDAAGSVDGTMGRVAGSVARAGIAMAAMAGAAGVALAGWGLSAAASAQQTTIAFEGILGSGEKAQAFLQQLRDFAAKTPFEFPELATASKNLLAVGFAAEDVIPTMTTIGNVAATLGVGADGIESVVRALGQMKGKGKASAEELQQLAEAMPGFVPIQAIAEHFGITTAEAFDKVAKGSVSADEAIGAILDSMKKFPGAAGAMERQALTLNGVISTFKDTARDALVEGLAPILPALASSISDAMPAIKSAMTAIGQTFGRLLSAAMPVLNALLPVFARLVDTVGKLLAGAFERIGPLIEKLAPQFDKFLGAVLPLGEQLLNALIPALETLAPVILEVGTSTALNMLPAFQILAPVIEALAKFVAMAVDALGPMSGVLLLAAGAAMQFNGGLGGIATGGIPNLIGALAAMPAAFGPWGLAVGALITTMGVLLDTSGLNNFEVALKGSAETLRDTVLAQKSLTGDATNQWVTNYLKQAGTLDEFNKILSENSITFDQFMAKFTTATDGTMGWARSLNLSTTDAYRLAGAVQGMDLAFLEAQQSAIDAAKVNGDLGTVANITSSILDANAAAMRQLQKDTGTTDLSFNSLLRTFGPTVDATKTLIAATLEQGGSQEWATSVLVGYRNKLVDQMVASGIAEGKANDLANALLGINQASPAVAIVDVDTQSALQKLAELRAALAPVWTVLTLGFAPNTQPQFGGAEGAIVSQPTIALIGEAGPEAVVPLHTAPGASALPSSGDVSGDTTIVVQLDSGVLLRALVPKVNQQAQAGPVFVRAAIAS